MTHKVVLRPEVADDLHGIVAYLEQSSIDVANRFAPAVFLGFDQLAEMPGMGSLKQFRSRPMRDIRSWAVPGFRNHLIYYRIHSDAVIVLGVMHGAREVSKELRSRT